MEEAAVKCARVLNGRREMAGALKTFGTPEYQEAALSFLPFSLPKWQCG